MFTHHWLADEVTIDWERVAARRNEIVGTSGDDDLRGTKGDDRFWAYQGGTDHLQGLGGDDRFSMGNSLDRSDQIDGGPGFDSVQIAGGPVGGPDRHIVITASMFVNIERLALAPSENFDVELRNGLGDLKIVAPGPGTLVFDASALRTGSVDVVAGARDDTIVGSQSDDRLVGSIGADSLTGGQGEDRFAFRSFFDNDPRFGSDTITDFERGDSIRLPSLDGTYHLGTTPGHTGDIIVSYNQDDNTTMVTVFGDDDIRADTIFYMMGDHSSLVLHNGIHLIET